jgi:hypothetical protein
LTQSEIFNSRAWHFNCVHYRFEQKILLHEDALQSVEAVLTAHNSKSGFLGYEPTNGSVFRLALRDLKKALDQVWAHVALNCCFTIVSNFSSFFRSFSPLDQVAPDWSNERETDEVIVNAETTKEFYRLWSIMEFLFIREQHVHTQGMTPATLGDMEVFGDGFLWAGCSIVHMLQQHERDKVSDGTERERDLGRGFEPTR